jgi:hypothetical protein
MKHLLITLLLASGFASCAKETPQQQPTDGEAVQLKIVPTVMEAGAGNIGAATHAKVEDNLFPLGAMMGLGISAPAATPALAAFYQNFYALNGGDAWRYYLNGVNAGTVLSGFSSWNDIELYGYYPYDATATDLTQIPFRIATLNGAVAEGTDATAMTDYMVAGTKTKNMATPSPAGELTLEFGHTMTAIDLYINRVSVTNNSNNMPALKLGSVTFDIAGGREFIVAGTYNAIDPDMTTMQSNITPGETATQMTITYPQATNINYVAVSAVNPLPARLLVIMPELRHIPATAGFEDATVTLTFSFVDQDGTEYLLEDVPGGKPTITFKLSDITNSGTTDMGLLAGYSYGVTATIGTYTHFSAPAGGTPTPPHVNYDPLVDADEDHFIDI